MPLNLSEAEAESIAGKLVDAVQHAPEKEEPSESPSKRVKIHHSAEVKDWFLGTRSLGLSHRCCSGPHCVCFSLCASQAHPPMLHQSRQHVRGTASGHWSDDTLQGRARHCMRQLLCVHTARHHPCRWKRRSLRQPCTEQESHACLGERSSPCIAEPGENPLQQLEAHCGPYSAQVLDKARQHMAEGTLFRSGKRGPLPEGGLQGMAPHEIATSILCHADARGARRGRGRGRPNDL